MRLLHQTREHKSLGKLILPEFYHNMFRVVAVMLIAAALNLWPFLGYAQSGRTILLLNSYSYDQKWTRSITDAVAKELDKRPDVQLLVEFMDTKRYASPEYYAELYEIFQRKYAKAKLDVVITSDDNAVNFALEHRQTLFPGVPIVFCGVNNVALPGRTDFVNITGALEVPGFRETIALALKLHPNAKNIYLVNESETIGKSDRALIEKILNDFSDTLVSTWLEDYSEEKLNKKLASVSQDSIILLLSFFGNQTDGVFKPSEGANFVSNAGSLPVYSMWEYFLGEGIVGGKLTSGTYQGITAADMALRVLDGRKTDHIPVVSHTANKYMFDYEQLQRFKIRPSSLPANSVVINEPSSILRKYRLQLAAAGVVIICLVVTCTIMAVSIRARKKAERDLAELNHTLEQLVDERTDELIKRSQELEKANQELKKLDELKTGVLNTVSHDLRTPLTSVLGFCKLVAMDFEKYFKPLTNHDAKLQKKSERISDNLGVIGQEGERLTRLVNDFLDLSKIDSGKTAWGDVRLETAVELRNKRSVLQGFFGESDVTFEMVVKDNAPNIIMDPDRFMQVVTNLVANAAKFSQQGVVTLQAEKNPQGHLQVSVTDQGTGIPEKELKQIFEKFYQVQDDSHHAIPRGSGMGLAISKRIVDHYNGSIWVTSTHGEGSSFVFTIPPTS